MSPLSPTIEMVEVRVVEQLRPGGIARCNWSRLNSLCNEHCPILAEREQHYNNFQKYGSI